MAGTHRPHRPEELGPRVFRKGRYWSLDLRPWGGGRPVARDPTSAGWPERGERTTERDIAERWRIAYWDWVRGLHRARVLKLPKDRRLRDAVADYLEHRMGATERATHDGDRSALRLLLANFPAHTQITRIDRDGLQAIIKGMLVRRLRPGTLYNYRKAWRTFFRWAGEYDPTVGLMLPESGTTDVITLEPHELTRLRSAADVVGARLPIELGLCMGLRQAEIFALRWEAIDAAEWAVRVNWQLRRDSDQVKPLKGKKARSALILEPWWSHHRQAAGLVIPGPLKSRGQRDMIRDVLDAAGLNATGRGWHILRHTYSRHVIEQGGRLEELQKFLGHTSIKTTEQHYSHMRADVAVRSARERISASRMALDTTPTPRTASI